MWLYHLKINANIIPLQPKKYNRKKCDFVSLFLGFFVFSFHCCFFNCVPFFFSSTWTESALSQDDGMFLIMFILEYSTISFPPCLINTSVSFPTVDQRGLHLSVAHPGVKWMLVCVGRDERGRDRKRERGREGGTVREDCARSGRTGGRAGHQHTGRVKKLRGWRSDQTGLRRQQPKLWGKLTGTNRFLNFPHLTFPPFFFLRVCWFCSAGHSSPSSCCGFPSSLLQTPKWRKKFVWD